MRPLKLISIIVLSVLAISCNKKDENVTDKVVLQGYLFEGQPVNSITLKNMVAFGSTDTSSEPINDATVTIINNNKLYLLQPDGEMKGNYVYKGSDLKIISGETYRIEVNYFGKIASAETTVPTKPQNFNINKDTVKVPEFNFGGFLDTASVEAEADSIVFTWEAAIDDYYYIVINNIDTNPKSIIPDWIPLDIVNFFIYSTPIQVDKYVVNELDLSHFGRHEYNVYKINQEYVDLFTNLNQDSRTLNEPITNVDNGLGVFASFNSANGVFYVAEP